MAVIINYLDILFNLIDLHDQGKLDDAGKIRLLKLCKWHDNDI
jgi:hypothetical protein